MRVTPGANISVQAGRGPGKKPERLTHRGPQKRETTLTIRGGAEGAAGGKRNADDLRAAIIS